MFDLADKTALVTGASGGVGSAAIQLAVARGARVVAVASADKAERLLGLGVDAVIDRGEPDLARRHALAMAGAVVVCGLAVGLASHWALAI